MWLYKNVFYISIIKFFYSKIILYLFYIKLKSLVLKILIILIEEEKNLYVLWFVVELMGLKKVFVGIVV